MDQEGRRLHGAVAVVHFCFGGFALSRVAGRFVWMYTRSGRRFSPAARVYGVRKFSPQLCFLGPSARRLTRLALRGSSDVRLLNSARARELRGRANVRAEWRRFYESPAKRLATHAQRYPPHRRPTPTTQMPTQTEEEKRTRPAAAPRRTHPSPRPTGARRRRGDASDENTPRP